MKSLAVKELTDNMFVGSGYSNSPTGCDAIYFFAFNDSGMTVSLMSNWLWMTPSGPVTPGATSVTPQYLNIMTYSPFSLTFYLQGKNTGNVGSAAGTITVTVCSAVSLSSSSSLQKDITGAPGSVEYIYKGYYIMRVSTADCPIDQFELVTSLSYVGSIVTSYVPY